MAGCANCEHGLASRDAVRDERGRQVHPGECPPPLDREAFRELRRAQWPRFTRLKELLTERGEMSGDLLRQLDEEFPRAK